MTQQTHKTERKVLELKHHIPYDGCYWEYNYWLIDVTPPDLPDTDSDDPFDIPNTVIAVEPIYTSNKENLLSEAAATRYYYDWFENYHGDEYVRNLDTPVVYEIDEDLYDQISLIFWGLFSKALPGDFSWVCDGCGMRQFKDPFFGEWHIDYRGNGGIGIEITNIYCDECAKARKKEAILDHIAWKTWEPTDKWHNEIENDENPQQRVYNALAEKMRDYEIEGVMYNDEKEQVMRLCKIELGYEKPMAE